MAVRFFCAFFSLFCSFSYANSNIMIDATLIGDELRLDADRYSGWSILLDNSKNVIYISDNYNDINISAGSSNIPNTSSIGLKRGYSLFSIILTGINYGHTVAIKGKMLNTELISSNANARSARNFINNGCDIISGNGKEPSGYYKIHSGTDFLKECSGNTPLYNYNNANININGAIRKMALQINKSNFKNIPPDSYSGSIVYQGDGLFNQQGDLYIPRLSIRLKINKFPYFSGVHLSSQSIKFITKNQPVAGIEHAIGEADLHFSLYGEFSGKEKIKIDIRSDNGFKLLSHTPTKPLIKPLNTHYIPYSITLNYLNKKYSMVNNGVYLQSVLLSPSQQAKNVNGSIDFNFSTPLEPLANGFYTDNILFMATLLF